MTEKEKAKAYDEAIERAKKLYGNGIIEEIFPELKESKDKKIREAILKGLIDCRDAPDLGWSNFGGIHIDDCIAWLEKQRDKDKLIQELGEYKVKYTQEVLEKYINSMSNKDDERLRKTAIAFLKDFAEQGYENAVECIDWLEKQGEQAPIQTNERAWLYLVSDMLTWKDGIGQYLDDPRVQELAKRLSKKYAQKLYNPLVLSNSSNIGNNKQKLENQWISVEEDLPCNHEELLNAKYGTKEVVILKTEGFPDVDYMLKINGKWTWFAYKNSKFWMPIPELPKE